MADDTNTAERDGAHNIIALSPLPPAAHNERVYGGHGNEIVHSFYTAHQMRYYARQEVFLAEQAWQDRASLAASAGSEPVAYAVFAENGNIRVWATEPQHVKRIAAEQGLKLVKLYTHPSPPEGMAGWKPIETAPEKGVFLVYMPTADRDGDRIQVAVWHPNVKVVGNLFAFDCAPITHWMPLPAPPLPASEAKEL